MERTTGIKMAEGGISDENFGSLTDQARRLINGLPNFEYQLQQYCSSGRKHMTILLCGKTGVGKSHLTNALIGRVLAKEGDDLDPETAEVTPYHFTINNVKITVYDTPGLADGTGNEEEYLRKIKDKITDFDAFIFCTEMNTQRFRTDDINTVKKLTKAFGPQLWEHAVVVLTFANEVHPPRSKRDVTLQEFFEDRMRRFKKKIWDVIKNAGVGEDVVITIPFVAAGDLSEPELPGIANWMTAFWIATFKRLNRSARSAFFLASIDRINFSACDIPRRYHPSRRSLPPQEFAYEDKLKRQMMRRSFQGFELEDRQHGGDQNSDRDDDDELRRLKSHSMPVRRSRTPPLTKPKPKRTVRCTDAPKLDMNEPSAKEVFAEVIGEVGQEASKILGEYIRPGTGRFFGIVFSWIVRLIKKWLSNDSSEESGSEKDEPGSEHEKD